MKPLPTRRDLGSNERRLKPVHPNAGIHAAFRKALLRLIDEMQGSYLYWLRAQYRQTPPRLALDAIPARQLQKELNGLGSRWRKRWNSAAPKLADWFSQSVEDRSSAVLRKILRDAGITVKFTMTAGMRDVFAATVQESVSLIKSIPQQYHTEVEGLVMRSVKEGRKLDVLTRQLQHRYHVTRKRAELIARDQNNKATAVFTKVRQLELGIEEAIWQHSGGGKEPRKTHVANSGKRYKVAEGWFDPDKRVRRKIFPGELINCRCVSRPVVKGFT